MDLAIKVYDIDYSFLLKNYLNPEYWNKSWHLFVYKDLKLKRRMVRMINMIMFIIILITQQYRYLKNK